jgi:transcription elongation factor Elf1
MNPFKKRRKTVEIVYNCPCHRCGKPQRVYLGYAEIPKNGNVYLHTCRHCGSATELISKKFNLMYVPGA